MNYILRNSKIPNSLFNKIKNKQPKNDLTRKTLRINYKVFSVKENQKIKNLKIKKESDKLTSIALPKIENSGVPKAT